MDPLDLLNADGWWHVVDHVKKPQNKLNLVECLPKLDHFPEFKINEWKMAAGLMILAKHSEKRMFPDWKNSFIKYRLMNSYIRSVIDRWLDKHGIVYCHLSKSEKVEKCISEIDSGAVLHPPIINGAVRIYCQFPEANEEHWNLTLDRAMPLLLRIAKPVKKLRLIIENIPNYSEGSALIYRLFSTLPNLEEARLTFQFNPTQELRQNREVAPVPKLPRLQELDIEYSDNSQPFKLREIFPPLLPCPDLSQNFTNISSLKLPLALWKPEYFARPLHFPKLFFLQLESIKFGDAADENKFFSIFTKIKAPLRMVFLKFSNRLEKPEHLYFMKNLVLCWLKENYPGYKCCISDQVSISYLSFYVLTTKLYLEWRKSAEGHNWQFVDF